LRVNGFTQKPKINPRRARYKGGIAQLKAEEPSRTCIERNKEEDIGDRNLGPVMALAPENRPVHLRVEAFGLMASHRGQQFTQRPKIFTQRPKSTLG